MTLTDNGDGTATLSGTPAAGTGGAYPITITATNGVEPGRDAGLHADRRPGSDDHLGAEHDLHGRQRRDLQRDLGRTSRRRRSPRPGPCPRGVTFTDNGDGTATLSGTPAAGTGGAYPITITATNGVGPDATQSFTLTVDQAPTITSGAEHDLHGRQRRDLHRDDDAASRRRPSPRREPAERRDLHTTTVTAPPPCRARRRTAAVAIYPLTVTASNGVGNDATQSFTLTWTRLRPSPRRTRRPSPTRSRQLQADGRRLPGTRPSPVGATLPKGITFTNGSLVGHPDEEGNRSRSSSRPRTGSRRTRPRSSRSRW